jgi:ATP-dependent DNA helicase PIF1
MYRFDVISKAIFNKQSNVYISGIAGSGKSYLLRQLFEEATSKKLNCVLTSTTGVSAFNIGGCTIHSWSGIVLPTQLPKDVEEYINRIVTRIKFKRYLLKKWKNLKILFIDEVSMLGANYIDVLDTVARRIRNNPQPFGGIQVVASGDMLQLPPVNDSFCFDSPCWGELNFTNFVLTKAYRFTSQAWSDILQRARIGKLTKEDIIELRKCINKQNNSDIQPTVIYSLRRDVDDLNEVALDDLPTSFTTFEAEDTLGIEDKVGETVKIVHHCTEEQSKVLDSNLNIGRSVKLKIGAQVMLVANLDVSMGLVNGSRGVITKLSTTEVTVKFKGKEHEFEMPIQPFGFKIEHQGEILLRKIVPLIPAYATTIHKCQGVSLDCAIVNCGDSIFSPAQAYVALSRVRSIEGLFLEQLKLDKIYPNKHALQFEEKMKKKAIYVDHLTSDNILDEEPGSF